MIFNNVPILIEVISLLAFSLSIALASIWFISRKPAWAVSMILLVIGIGTMLQNIFRQRLLIVTNPDFINQQSELQGNELWVRVAQLTTLSFILLCILTILISFAYRERRLPRKGFALTVIGLIAYLPTILSALVSAHGGIGYGLFLFPLLIITIYISPRIKLSDLFLTAKIILLLFVYTSILAMFLFPDWAIEAYNQSVIGLNIRLFGTTSHPNTMGYISLAYLMLSRLETKKFRWRFVHLGASIFTLILSQSKTAWAAGIIWVCIIMIATLIHNHQQKQILFRIILSFFVIGIVVSIYFFLAQGKMLEIFNNDFKTLTGRIYVWKITLDTWQKNPLFGYGPNLWNLDFRLQFGNIFLWAGGGHNQILQTLGESGIVGLLGFIAYLFAIIKYGSQNITKTNSASAALVLLFIAYCFTETPMRNIYINEGFLVHGILFFLLINSERALTSKPFVLNTNFKKNSSNYEHPRSITNLP